MAFDYDGDAISDTEWAISDEERFEENMERIKRVEVEITNPVNEDETLYVECEFYKGSCDTTNPDSFEIVEVLLYLGNGYYQEIDEQLFEEIVENLTDEIKEKALEKLREQNEQKG